MRYFELGLGNSIEEDSETFEYSICIKANREVKTFEEVNKFLETDLLNLGYKTVVSIEEIPEEEAKTCFDWEGIMKAPIFE